MDRPALSQWIARAALAALAVTSAGPLGAAGFTAGDLYLVTNSMGSGPAGIMRIAMPSGAVSEFYTFPGNDQMASTAIYDPYRDAIVFSRYSVGGPRMIDASGTETALGTGIYTPRVMATRGDGTIYLWQHFGDGSDAFHYVDAAGTLHELLNPAGTDAFRLADGRYLSELIYSPHTNSLIGIGAGFWPMVGPCADINQVCVVKIPLTANGLQVSGSMTMTSFDVSGSGEGVSGASIAPGGGILIVIDSNSASSEPHLTMLDPFTMTTSTFASTANASLNAGTWSHVLGLAVADDTFNNDLRAFSLGGSGAGTQIATGTSGGLGSNESARLMEVGGFGSVLAVAPPDPRGSLRLAASPNPMVEAAALRYSLGRGGRVSLAIHDIAGRTVRTLASADWQEAGPHQLAWDGRDASGARVRPGVYSAVLRTDEGRGVTSMVVVR